MTNEELTLQLEALKKEFQEFKDAYYHDLLVSVPRKINLKFAEGANIEVGTSTGTKIGTSITQKIGFFGATPVVNYGGITEPDTPGAAYNEAIAIANWDALITIIDALDYYGLISN